MCCAPFVTTALSTMFSNWQGSPFTHDEITEAAEATRDYTVGSHDEAALFAVIYDINEDAQKAGRATLSGAPDLPADGSMPRFDELAARLMLADDAYVLPSDALSHLDDVFTVVRTARTVLIVLAVVALVGCVTIASTRGRIQAGKTIMASPGVVLVLFAGLALWAALDFDGFFAFIHSLFFTAGTWTFSADSLLIRMYPEGFWTGMAVVWLATTTVACIVCLILGRLVKGKQHAVHH